MEGQETALKMDLKDLNDGTEKKSLQKKKKLDSYLKRETSLYVQVMKLLRKVSDLQTCQYLIKFDHLRAKLTSNYQKLLAYRALKRKWKLAKARN